MAIRTSIIQISAKNGGTNMYCPGCKEITTCKAIPAAQITMDTDDYYQRRYHTRHDDLNWFQRGRQCLDCGHEFVTAEVDYQFLEELIELRDALKEIKGNAENYIHESTAASKSLERLSKSLSVLRALKIYRSTKR